MATMNSPKANTSSTRRSSASPTPAPSIARGATARAAASPRVASPHHSVSTRRIHTRVSSTANGNVETQESLYASLKDEINQKEQLLIQLQSKDLAVSSLSADIDTLTSSLNGAEARLNELYAEQSRWEVELAQRIDISEKLRGQVRELEKEKRDLQRRYNDQTATFEAERQAFYDNEQHLKSRIQSLSQSQSRKEHVHTFQSFTTRETEPEEEEEEEEELEPVGDTRSQSVESTLNDPDNEPAEMTSLKLELSTLSTSYSSLQSTLVLLQSQLVDLKRVNNELQEENESYMILLREKTLSGQFDLIKQVGGQSATSDEEDDEDDEENLGRNADAGSLHSAGRSTLDPVDEESADNLEIYIEDQNMEFIDHNVSSPARNSRPPRQVRKRTISNSAPRGESLADLPITGPGLDLAAELGRAENKDMLAGNKVEERERLSSSHKTKRSRKTLDTHSHTTDAKVEATSGSDIDALRTEVKSLKDANKALSLYASKIIDRIIAQEGFEHVLAVDYDKSPTTPSTAVPKSPVPNSPPRSILRPQSVFVGRSSSNPGPTLDTKLASPPTPAASTKTNRRSLSFDWKNFSLFNTQEKKPDANLRPLTLKPGTTVTVARKLDTEEDEEDRRERERLNATMKLMGIQPSARVPQSPGYVQKSRSSTPPVSHRRFSMFGSRAGTDNSDSASVNSTVSLYENSNGLLGLGMSSNLTQEALEHAEAENSLAALDAHERDLSAELARGGSTGFTEIAPRSIGRRSRKSAGSGSTVWSAGMSGECAD